MKHPFLRCRSMVLFASAAMAATLCSIHSARGAGLDNSGTRERKVRRSAHPGLGFRSGQRIRRRRHPLP